MQKFVDLLLQSQIFNTYFSTNWHIWWLLRQFPNLWKFAKNRVPIVANPDSSYFSTKWHTCRCLKPFCKFSIIYKNFVVNYCKSRFFFVFLQIWQGLILIPNFQRIAKRVSLLRIQIFSISSRIGTFDDFWDDLANLQKFAKISVSIVANLDFFCISPQNCTFGVVSDHFANFQKLAKNVYINYCKCGFFVFLHKIARLAWFQTIFQIFQFFPLQIFIAFEIPNSTDFKYRPDL